MCRGGLNNQTYAAAGVEANLDTQFAYGLTYPTPATFFSTGGSPPFIPDAITPTDTNEPYVKVRLARYLPSRFVRFPTLFISVAGLCAVSRIPASDDLY